MSDCVKRSDAMTIAFWFGHNKYNHKYIKKRVMEDGARYRDFTLAIEDLGAYKEAIEKQFELLEIPYFIDERKNDEDCGDK